MKEDQDVRNLTMRQRMELHQSNAACSSCHSRMDPLGYALENFDGLGRWRDGVDSSGTLPDGTRVDGPAGLRMALLSRTAQFIRAVTECLFDYALARGVEPTA